MKKTMLVLAISIIIVYAAIAALLLDGGVLGGSAGTNSGAFTVKLLLNDSSVGGIANVVGDETQFNINEEFDLGSALPLAQSNNKSFTFDGWFVGNTRVTTFADVKELKGSAANVQVLAVWKARDFAIGETMFEIVLDLNNGVMLGGNIDRAVFGQLEKEFVVPTRNGFIFAGWYYKGEYKDTHKVETHEDMISLWNEDGRPNFVTVAAWWEVRSPQWWEVIS